MGWLGQHLPYCLPAQHERAADVHREDSVEVLVARVQQGPGVNSGEHRVVDQHVQAARPGDRTVYQHHAIGVQRDIRQDELAVTAAPCDELVGGLAAGQRIAAHVGEQHGESIAGQPLGNAAPDARRRASDDDRTRHAVTLSGLGMLAQWAWHLWRIAC